MFAQFADRMLSFVVNTFQFVGIALAYQTVRFYHWIMIRFRFLHHPSRIYTTITYSLLYPDHIETQVIVPRDLPADVLVVENVQRHTVTGALTKACIVRPNSPDAPFAPCQPPWWFIGAKLRNDGEVCITDMMSPYIVPGNVITPHLLDRLNPDIAGCRNLLYWFYIHPTSFEEREIPPEGVTIHGDRPAPPRNQPVRPPQVAPDDHEPEVDVPHED
jgi:hypothetical protein